MGQTTRHLAVDTPTDAEPVPALTTARIEMGADGHYRVRLRNGDLLRATADEDVHPDLIAECIRNRRRMLVEPTADGTPVIIGALQTDPTRARSARLDLTANEEVTLRAGTTTLALTADGRIALRANTVTMDAARLLKVHSAKVELP